MMAHLLPGRDELDRLAELQRSYADMRDHRGDDYLAGVVDMLEWALSGRVSERLEAFREEAVRLPRAGQAARDVREPTDDISSSLVSPMH